MRVFVINTGVCSAIGMNTAENYENLIKEKSGVSKIELVENLDKPYYGGEIKKSNSELKTILNVDSNTQIPRTALLGLIAAKEALGDLKVPYESIQLFSASTVGGMDLSEDFYHNFFSDNSLEGIEVLRYHDCGATSNWINDKLDFLKIPFTISSACSSSANAIMIAADSIKSGKNELALAGGADALCKFTINGFNSLMIYDAELCRPFDITRKGLNLGEGAAYLLLASEDYVKENNITPIAEFKSGANTNDAFHQTASSPDATGAKLAMINAMQKANLNAEDIAYVNAHGTATENNDNTEQKAINDLMPENIFFSSTKGFTGHTLAAAGSIEAVWSCLSLQHQKAFANIHCKEPIDVKRPPVFKTKEAKVDNVMSNSFGFGGNSTSLIFGKI